MWDFTVNYVATAYTQILFLALFVWYFLAHRRDPRMLVSRVGFIRMVVLLLIFLNFLFSWASGIRPALAQAAVFGMFIINLFLLNCLVLSRLEGPYRDALSAYCLAPQNLENLDAIWSTGRRFYYLRHFVSSIMSGESPLRYLHEIAGSRIRDDVQTCLRHRGLTHQFISLQAMINYLENRLAEENDLPPEFKEVMKKELQDLQKRPWLEEKINEYLKIALETPEKIHNPEWSLRWEKTRASKK